jgi:Fe2+ or Zn2+ uptake regulation protein
MAGHLTEAQSSMNGTLGRRSTVQRQLILGIIQQADGHLNADDIYQRARQESPSISLSTVYRSLQLFKELELVEEHQFDGMHRCCETTTRPKHHHLVCLGCGRIFEFQCPSAERLKSRISREEGFKVTDTEVRLAGYCPDCQRRLPDNVINTKQEQEILKRR